MSRLHLMAFVLALAIPDAFLASANVQSSGGVFAIDPATIAGGGATLSGGAFQLSGTIGQPTATTLAASSYSLYDGFWAPASALTDLIFANGFDP
jgi:hypothetical protein